MPSYPAPPGAGQTAQLHQPRSRIQPQRMPAWVWRAALLHPRTKPCGLQTLFVCSGSSRAATQHPGGGGPCPTLPTDTTQLHWRPAPTLTKNVSSVPPTSRSPKPPHTGVAAPAPLPGPGCGGTDTQRQQRCKADAGLGAALASYKYPGAEVTTKATAELCTIYHGNTAQPPNLTALYSPPRT